MPPTKHPREYRQCENNFAFGENPDRATGQASMTRVIDSHDGLPLGSDGQTRGFVKGMENPSRERNRLFANPLAPNDDGGLITRQVASYRADQLLGLNALSEEKYGKDEQGKVVGISIQADGSNVLYKKSVLQVDCTSSAVQRGLSDLQVSDFISGQMDRNPANIFVDPETGKVTGIDNDLAFPEVSPDQIEDGAQLYLGMPRMMHEETRDKILRTKPEDLRRILSEPPPDPGPKPLSQSAIDGAVNRLIALQTELRKPNSSIKVVKAFDHTTYQQAMTEQERSFQKQLDIGITDDFAKGYVEQHGRLTMEGFARIPKEDKGKRVPSALGNAFRDMQRTSLLGSVEAEKLKFKAIQVGRPDDMTEHHVGKKAPRLAFEQRERAAFEKRLADAYDKMSPSEKKSFDKTFAQLSKKEKEVASKQLHLQHPSLMDRLNALTKGDTAMRNQKQQSIVTLGGEITQIEKELNKLAFQKLPQISRVTVQPPLDQSNPLGQGQLPTRPRIANQPKRGGPTVDPSTPIGQGKLPIRPRVADQPKRTALTVDPSKPIGEGQLPIRPRIANQPKRGAQTGTQTVPLQRKESVRNMMDKDKGKRVVTDGNKVDATLEQPKVRAPKTDVSKNKTEVLHVSDTTGIKSPSLNDTSSAPRRNRSNSRSTS